MNDLYEALEICLRDIERGADIDTVLLHYPDLADELRPILETSRNAGSLAVPAPSVEVVRRNRARVLQHAAQLREAKARRSARRFWLVSFRRLAVTLAVVSILFASGTGLVRAASTTLPGDHLYPVKRTWEDVLVLFTFNLQQRDALEVEHENERLQELHGLFAEKRAAEVEFAGLVTSQNGSEWIVSGIPVFISPQTQVRNQGIAVGSAVQVKGQTQSNGAVSAEQIDALPPGSKLPDMNDEHENEGGSYQGGNPQIQDSSGEKETPTVEETESPNSGSKQDGGSWNAGSDKGGDSGSGDHSGGSNSGSSDSGGDHESSGGGD